MAIELSALWPDFAIVGAVDQNRQQYQQAQQQRAKDEPRARLLAWVDSGDPILETEARQQLSRMEAAAQALAGSG